MTEQHECEYVPTYHVAGHSGTAVGLCECGLQLSLHQLCWRANATERLSARAARRISNRTLPHSEYEELQTYADTLEGK